MTRKFLIAILLACTAANIAMARAKTRTCDNAFAVLFGTSFSLCLTAEQLNGAAIIRADDLLLKFKNGSYFFGKLITRDLDNLPDGFDMRTYPAYALGSKSGNDLPAAQAQALHNSLDVLKQTYGDIRPAVTKHDGKTIYLLTGARESIAYVSVDDNPDQVLQLGFHDVEGREIQSIIKGLK